MCIPSRIPVGPSSTVAYTLTIRNIGNADATGVSVVDPIPADTTFLSADHGGVLSGGRVTLGVGVGTLHRAWKGQPKLLP